MVAIGSASKPSRLARSLNSTIPSWSVGGRLFAGFLLIGAIFSAAVLATLWKVDGIKSDMDRIIEQRIPTAETSASMTTEINRSLASLRGWMLTKDEEYIAERAAVWADIDRNTKRMDRLSVAWDDGHDVAAWSEFKIVLNEFRHAQAAVEHAVTGPDAQRAVTILTTEAAPRANRLITMLAGPKRSDGSRSGGLAGKHRTQARRDAMGVHGNIKLLVRIEWVLLIGGLAIAGYVAARTTRSIVRPVEAITRAMTKLAGGDETVDIPATDRHDEIGTMANAVAVFKDNAADTRRLNEQLANIAENFPGVIYRRVRHPDGRITHPYISPGFQDFSGISTTEIANDSRRFISLMHPDDRSKWLERVSLGAYSEEPQGFELRLVNGAGETRWRKAVERSLRLENGDVVWDGVAVDITEQKRTEQALRDSEDKSRAIVNTVIAGIITIDEQGIIETVNPATERIFGYAAAALIGHNVSMLMPPRDRAQHDGYVANYLNTGNAKIIGIGREVLGKRKNGEIFPIDLSISEPYWSGKRMFTGIIRDVTERKRAEKSDRRLAAIVESTFDAVTATDLDGIVTDWNISSERLFGYSAQEMIGKPISVVVPDDRRHELTQRFEDIRRGRRPSNIETVRRRKDGSAIDVAVSASPIADGTGAIVGGSAIYRDITDIKRMEATVRQAHKIQALGNLAGGIAHDFNNALFPIIAITEVVMDDLPESSEARANLEKVLLAARHGRDLVRHIMTYSRQQPVSLEPVNLRDIVNETIDLLRATLPATIGIRSRLADDVGFVLADATQIREVIINLGANAAYAIGDRIGQLEIALERVDIDAGSAIPSVELAPGPYAQLAVHDTGDGMDEATMAQIFDPYFTTKPVGEGTGLGLAAVHGIIASHDGAVEVSSAQGQGTVFKIYLPSLIEDGSHPVRRNSAERNMKRRNTNDLPAR